LQFVGLHRIAIHPGQTFKRHHGMVATFHRPRIDVDVLCFLIADLGDVLSMSSSLIRGPP
jgi:hypothetical protein